MWEPDVFEKISNTYYHLTAAEKKVADYVVVRQRDTQYMSISELAEACGVAEATISRFAKRLNYKGYNAFKLAVANSIAGRTASMGSPLSGEVLPEDSVSDMCQKLFAAEMDAMEQTLGLLRPEAITAAGDLLAGAEKVLCMGQGGRWSWPRRRRTCFPPLSANISPSATPTCRALPPPSWGRGM